LSLVVKGYAKVKQGKTYRYHKCLAQRNGITARCNFGSVNANKVEEYLIEKLATLPRASSSTSSTSPAPSSSTR